MKEITCAAITETVRGLFIKANYELPPDAECLVRSAPEKESVPLAKAVLCRIAENLDAAAELKLPICQDTGMAVLFADVGQDVHITGGYFEDAVNEGVRRAYLEGFLRCSVVNEPLFERKNTGDNTPSLIHTRIVPGDSICFTAAPKGFGSENMSALKMMTPAAKPSDIVDFVVETVKRAGGNPCPPIMIGVGIGGTFEGCALLAKRAVVRDVSIRNPDSRYAELEQNILEAVNKTGVGAQGFGGDVTALAVNIEYSPTHIAGLPVAVNINCHVMRHARTLLTGSDPAAGVQAYGCGYGCAE
ncbi:MAG: fumarate hydratase [Clostridiales bacterium]|mgnify:CR=1 FL=1|nr:fumarate hydratase [Clostridiales bacterium]